MKSVPTQGALRRQKVRPSPQPTAVSGKQAGLLPKGGSQTLSNPTSSPPSSQALMSVCQALGPILQPSQEIRPAASPHGVVQAEPRRCLRVHNPSKMNGAGCGPESCRVRLVADSGYAWREFPSSFSNPSSQRQKEFFRLPHLLT